MTDWINKLFRNSCIFRFPICDRVRNISSAYIHTDTPTRFKLIWLCKLKNKRPPYFSKFKINWNFIFTEKNFCITIITRSFWIGSKRTKETTPTVLHNLETFCNKVIWDNWSSFAWSRWCNFSQTRLPTCLLIRYNLDDA